MNYNVHYDEVAATELYVRGEEMSLETLLEVR